MIIGRINLLQYFLLSEVNLAIVKLTGKIQI